MFRRFRPRRRPADGLRQFHALQHVDQRQAGDVPPVVYQVAEEIALRAVAAEIFLRLGGEAEHGVVLAAVAALLVQQPGHGQQVQKLPAAVRVQAEVPADLRGGHLAASAENFRQPQVQEGFQEPRLGAAGQKGVIATVAVPQGTGRRKVSGRWMH